MQILPEKKIEKKISHVLCVFLGKIEKKSEFNKFISMKSNNAMNNNKSDPNCTENPKFIGIKSIAKFIFKNNEFLNSCHIIHHKS
jgi:hypothetical protein